eukprot:m.212385 g.212385  ORF g.212385 m.212385 type:complete len:139 (-) comp15852_c0_seq3:409-825(-)
MDQEKANILFEGQEDQEKHVESLCTGPSGILLLTKNTGDAVEFWKELIGPEDPEAGMVEGEPTTLRSRFGSSLLENGLHGSESTESAMKEIQTFFPEWYQENLEESEEETQASEPTETEGEASTPAEDGELRTVNKPT